VTCDAVGVREDGRLRADVDAAVSGGNGEFGGGGDHIVVNNAGIPPAGDCCVADVVRRFPRRVMDVTSAARVHVIMQAALAGPAGTTGLGADHQLDIGRRWQGWSAERGQAELFGGEGGDRRADECRGEGARRPSASRSNAVAPLAATALTRWSGTTQVPGDDLEGGFR